jgi:cell division septation protein DedD
MATSINIAGFTSCGDFQRARAAAQGLGTICPDKFSVNIQEFAGREEYNSWLAEAREVGDNAYTQHPLSPKLFS